jgi:hypothetical protein
MSESVSLCCHEAGGSVQRGRERAKGLTVCLLVATTWPVLDKLTRCRRSCRDHLARLGQLKGLNVGVLVATTWPVLDKGTHRLRSGRDHLARLGQRDSLSAFLSRPLGPSWTRGLTVGVLVATTWPVLDKGTHRRRSGRDHLARLGQHPDLDRVLIPA